MLRFNHLYTLLSVIVTVFPNHVVLQETPIMPPALCPLDACPKARTIGNSLIKTAVPISIDKVEPGSFWLEIKTILGSFSNVIFKELLSFPL